MSTTSADNETTAHQKNAILTTCMPYPINILICPYILTRFSILQSFVTVTVSGQQFDIHKQPLPNTRRSLTRNLTEILMRVAGNVDTTLFGIFVNWLYCQRLRCVGTDRTELNLVELGEISILGEWWMALGLQDVAMELIPVAFKGTTIDLTGAFDIMEFLKECRAVHRFDGFDGVPSLELANNESSSTLKGNANGCNNRSVDLDEHFDLLANDMVVYSIMQSITRDTDGVTISYGYYE